MLTKQRTKNPDFTDLQNEVMDLWDSQGIEYTRTENLGFTPPDPAFYEANILPEFETLLDNPLWCVQQLGFDSLASYIASKEDEITYDPGVIAQCKNMTINSKGHLVIEVNLADKPRVNEIFNIKNRPTAFMSGVLSKQFREAHYVKNA